MAGNGAGERHARPAGPTILRPDRVLALEAVLEQLEQNIASLERLDLDDSELAIACASHRAELFMKHGE